MALFAKDESLGLSEEGSGENELEFDENFGCGRMKALPQPKGIKPGERLTLRRRGRMDQIRGRVSKPPRYLPPLHLPAWPHMTLDQKLPVVRSLKGTLFYSRGIVGQKLYQAPKCYSNYDPFNLERVVNEPYNALHDPYAKGYLQKPQIQKFLMRQGLITRTSQVICSVQDFNKYRTYLNTLYKEDINKEINEMGDHQAGNRKMDKDLMFYLNKTEGKVFNRMQNMAKRKRELEVAKAERLALKQKMDEDRQFRLQMEKESQQRALKLKAMERDMVRKEKLLNGKNAERIGRERLVQTMIVKEQQNKERIMLDKEVVGQSYRQFLLEWMDTKWQTQEEKMGVDEVLEQSLETTMKEKAEMRQKHVENYRAQLPQLLEKQKAKNQRLMDIVRKYFYRWLNNVRKRKARKPDAQHQSLWDTSVVVDDTLNFLRKESGYEKLDDFILSILKLKRDIAKEMAAEEEAEARAAAALAESQAAEAEAKGEELPDVVKEADDQKPEE